jgi:acyl carrier protein
VVEDRTTFAEHELRAHLRRHLHSAMVPTAIHVADDAGLSVTGKLDLPAGAAPGGTAAGRTAAVPVCPAAAIAAVPPTAVPAGPPSAVPAGSSAGVPAGRLAITPLAVRPPAVTTQAARPDAWHRQTSVGSLVARLFAEIAEVPQHTVGVDTDFFSIGGDSLSLAELHTKLEHTFQVQLDIDEVIDDPTPEAIALLVQRHALVGTK